MIRGVCKLFTYPFIFIIGYAGIANAGQWVGSQRSRQERLTSERINRLDELGFVTKSH